MNKIIVRVSNGKQTYEEDVTQEVIEHFEECVSNGANKHLEKIKFEHYTRPIKEDLTIAKSLDKYNHSDKNAHFIFGWLDCFSQSSHVPEWIYNTTDLFIEVINI